MAVAAPSRRRQARYTSYLSVNWQDPVEWTDPLNNGLVSWWMVLPHWQGIRPWRDLCRRNEGTLTNGPTWQGPQGRPGGWGSLRFDGTDSYVVANHNGACNPATWTVALYVRLEGGSVPSDYPTFFANDSRTLGVQRATTLGLFSNLRNFIHWKITGSGDTEFVNIPFSMEYDRWYHVALSFDRSFVKRLYFDGVQIATETAANATTATPTDFLIGGGAPFNGFLQGSLDDVRFFPRALSPAEVLALYQDSRQGYPRTLRRRRGVCWKSTQIPASANPPIAAYCKNTNVLIGVR